MNYYKSNALYDDLDKREGGRFVWTSGNAWILLYANEHASVRVIAFVKGISTHQVNAATKVRLALAQEKAACLARMAGIVFTAIEFDDNAEEISTVCQDGDEKTSNQLKDWFASNGLAVDGGATAKAINNAASSPYHKWQRSSLGAIKVTDIDLLRLEPQSGNVTEIHELKRSFEELENWSPYQADFPNFNVIADLAARVALPFSIVYNVRKTQPEFFDDVSRLSLFSYSRMNGVKALDVVTLAQFVA